MKRVTYRELGRAGRIGNQCWQVASTIGLARRHGVDPIFPDTWSYRPWFSLPDGWYGTPREIQAATPAQRLSRLPANQRNYLQQYHYIRDSLDEIQAAFAPSAHACKVMFDHLRDTDQKYLVDLTDDGVTVHVRRGDNMDPKTHPPGTWPPVTMDYYREAIGLFDPDAPLVIFSDDPAWCRDHVADICPPRPGCIYVAHSGPTRPPEYLRDGKYAASPALDWIDLQLMAMFSRHVIAGSTYSLWGAMLGPGPTVYPNNWVGWRCRDQVPPEHTMVPPEWVMVDNPHPPEIIYGPDGGASSSSP